MNEEVESMMDYGVAVPVIASFVISAAAGPVVIPVLRKMKVGQTVRDDGPQTHLKKNGTPTMGGTDFSVQRSGGFPVLCEGLSEDNSCSFCDSGFWDYRFSG